MKKIILAIFFSFLFAADMPLLIAFKKGYYSQICMNRWIYINKYLNKREDLLSLVAYACLKKRYLTPALDLAKVLKKTPLGRKNATYITTLFLIKKLILEYIFDDIDLKNIKLPVINDNLLGIVFNLLSTNKVKKEKNEIKIFDKNEKYIIFSNTNYNIVIEQYLNNKLIKKEIYW